MSIIIGLKFEPIPTPTPTLTLTLHFELQLLVLELSPGLLNVLID